MFVPEVDVEEFSFEEREDARILVEREDAIIIILTKKESNRFKIVLHIMLFIHFRTKACTLCKELRGVSL